MRQTSNLFCVAGFTLLGLVGNSAMATATDTYVEKLYYKNKGAYEINHVEVVWEYKKDKNRRSFDKLFYNGEMFCFDVKQWNDDHKDDEEKQYLVIPEGAELHLNIKIDEGDSLNCKKDGHKFLAKEGGTSAYFNSSGTTKNNNHCQISDSSEGGDIKSGNC